MSKTASEAVIKSKVLLFLMLAVLTLLAAACEGGTPSKILFTYLQPKYPTSNDWEIWVMDDDGRNQINLTNNPALDEYPCWSPDGKKIAFVSERDGNREIYVMDADGANLRNLTNNPASDDYPRWSSDGKKIYFTSYRGGKRWLYTIDAHGKNQTMVPYYSSDWSSWVLSPDGGKVAFQCYREGAEDIWILDIKTGAEANLTHHPSRDKGPIWSPDGREIAFTSERDGPCEVYVLDADGSNLRKVTTYSATVPTPEQRGQIPPGYLLLAWFPDGEKLLAWLCEYDANFDIMRWDLYAIDKYGKTEVNLTRDLPDIGAYPVGSCSPDGSKIAFSTWISNLPESGNVSEIWVVDANGSNLTRLTYNQAWDEGPTWQPR